VLELLLTVAGFALAVFGLPVDIYVLLWLPMCVLVVLPLAKPWVPSCSVAKAWGGLCAVTGICEYTIWQYQDQKDQ